MDSNSIIKNLLDKNPVLLKDYETEFNNELDYLQLKSKEPLKEHEWWKEYLIEEKKETINDISIQAKYDILTDIIIELTDNLNTNKETLNKIFINVEKCLEHADEDVLGEIETLFFEGIINRISNKGTIYNYVMSLLGPKSRFLCDRNNDFWEKSGLTNRSMASAVRKETKNGQVVGPRSHVKKVQHGIKSLERWIEENPTASPGDRADAENMLKDLMSSLGY